jgi:hypothetical protein
MADYSTARIYASDAKRLLKLQLAVAEREGQLPAVADVIHRLIDMAEERGNG